MGAPRIDVGVCRGRVLATLLNSSTRMCDLILPVIRRLGPDRCTVLLGEPGLEARLPSGVPGIPARGPLPRNVAAAWRRDYRQFWRDMGPTTRALTAERRFPSGVYHRLADAIVSVTQEIAGFLDFLARGTGRDPDGARSIRFLPPLTLSAAMLGIPTYTLVHGPLGENCRSFFPLLADKVFCWGQIDQGKFIEIGVDPSRTILGGCPRLTRDLPLPAGQARAKLGLDPDKPLVMFATATYQQVRDKLAQAFCEAVCGEAAFSAVVRLHPVETLQTYAELIARFPQVKFLPSKSWPVDEALAAAAVVVVHSSGLGSDALAKRRLTVVLDVGDFPLGHGQDLVDLAGCPRARSADQLRDILRRLLGDEEEQDERRRAAERFVSRFYDAFGEESASRIAERLLASIATASASVRAPSPSERLLPSE